jgi:hypothetical protein
MSWATEHGLATRLAHIHNEADRLPLILCGPILRRTEPDSVTVWVALKKACTVTLRVYSHAPPPAPESLREEMQGTRRTIRLGEHLHVVAVTARPVAADRPLTPGTVYFYNLFFSEPDVSVVPETNEHLNSPNVFELEGAASLDSLHPTGLSYSIEHRLPSFSLPPQDINKLRIIHGSCRMPHGTGRDALPTLDEIISLDYPVADDRPHLLLLTGDQIYADDVAHSLLFLLMDASKPLLGWNEVLPGVTQEEESRLQPSKRKPIVIGKAQFTTEDPQNHLLSLGEYYAMYLFTWSDVLWPIQFPEYDDVKNDDLKRKKYDSERKHLLEFRKTIREVRRAMANVPSYMMVDDHDITDDWNMLRAWCEQVYSAPLGRRVIQNGLLSYAIFQGWGNTPDRFAANQPGDALLTAAAGWSQSQGTAQNHKQEIERLVGVPGTMNSSGQVSGIFTEEGELSRLSTNEALKWYYTIKSPNFEILVLDSRTQKAFTSDGYAPAHHIAAASLDEQLPLDNVDPNKVVMVVSPNNIFTVPSFHEEKVFGESFIRKWWYIAFRISVDILLPFLQLIGKVPEFSHYNPDLNESWIPQSQTFESLLSRLSRRTAMVNGEAIRRSRVLLLTGDVHFSWASRMQYWAEHPFDATPSTSQPVEAIFAQLASSPFNKEESFRDAFHNWGYIPMTDSLPGSIQWFGWKDRSSLGISPQDMGRMADWVHMEEWMSRHTPPMLSVIDAPGTHSSTASHPHWRYRLDFMLGEKSGNDFTLNLLEKPNPGDHDRWLKVIGEAQDRHRNYAHKWGDGLELVGKNSLGELRLQWEGATTLVSAINATEKSFRVAAPDLLPAPPLLVRINDEIIKVGAVHRGTGVCSKVERGQRGTTAASHPANAAVTVFKTATQTQWWRLTAETKLLPLTRYTLSLSYDDPQFPKPKLPGEANS